MNYDNIIVIGNSGIGKSTLINACLEENVAPAEYGIKGTADKLKIYTSSKIPYDQYSYERKMSLYSICNYWSHTGHSHINNTFSHITYGD